MFGQKKQNDYSDHPFFLGDFESPLSTEEPRQSAAPRSEEELPKKPKQGGAKQFKEKLQRSAEESTAKIKEYLAQKKEAWLQKRDAEQHADKKEKAKASLRQLEQTVKEKAANIRSAVAQKKEPPKTKEKVQDTPAPKPEEKTEVKAALLVSVKPLPEKETKKRKKQSDPLLNQSIDLTQTTLADFLRQGETDSPVSEAKPEAAKNTSVQASPEKKKKGKDVSVFASKKKEREKALKAMEEAKPALSPEEAVKASLDGMYDVYHDPKQAKKKTLSPRDYVRYGILFVCIFGFFLAGFFVFRKLYDYYRSYVIYSRLQEMVSQKDYFAGEYLKKAAVSFETLTPEEILAGKTPEGIAGNAAFTEEQETLVGKISQLKKINPDTAGWITINGTVVNYPLVWSPTRNYYLHRDFYKNTLSSGAIFMDDRNDPDLTKNRNTVIYGHNMSDGSMFASIHDFASASVFFGTKIEIATENGIFIYTPFSVHSSNAFDNYFETNFVSDDDFLNFCEQMAFLSIFETDTEFNKNSQIITLSTCMDNQSTTEERFAVHAILTQVIR